MVAELDGFEEVLEAGFLFDRFHREVGAVHQSLHWEQRYQKQLLKKDSANSQDVNGNNDNGEGDDDDDDGSRPQGVAL